MCRAVTGDPAAATASRTARLLAAGQVCAGATTHSRPGVAMALARLKFPWTKSWLYSGSGEQAWAMASTAVTIRCPPGTPDRTRSRRTVPVLEHHPDLRRLPARVRLGQHEPPFLHSRHGTRLRAVLHKPDVSYHLANLAHMLTGQPWLDFGYGWLQRYWNYITGQRREHHDPRSVLLPGQPDPAGHPEWRPLRSRRLRP